jgi:hypothetical protein
MDALGPALVALKYVEALGYEASFTRNLGSDDGALSIPWIYHAEQLVQLQRNTNGGYTWIELERLLPSARACQATDRRDTVFSVLGLADPEIYPVNANYRQDLKDVLITATRAVIAKDHGLDIMGACQNAGKQYGLPSWVPNLSEPWKAMPFNSYKAEMGGSASRILDLAITDRDNGIVQIEGECLILRGGHMDAVAIFCQDVVSSNASSDQLDAIFESWQKFVSTAAKTKALNDMDTHDFINSGNSETRMNWIRFLSVLQDEARDMRSYSYSDKKKKQDKRAGDAGSASMDAVLKMAKEELSTTHQYYHLNFKLTCSHLLPANYPIRLHPDRRIHAGLKRHGPGRRLCITKRGFLALIPAEAEVEDPIALFQGASFPYVLRKYGGKKRYVLVGEAFVPGYSSGKGGRLAKEEFKVGLDAIFRLY